MVRLVDFKITLLSVFPANLPANDYFLNWIEAQGSLARIRATNILWANVQLS